MYRLPETKHLAYDNLSPRAPPNASFRGGLVDATPEKPSTPGISNSTCRGRSRQPKQTAIDKLLLEGAADHLAHGGNSYAPTRIRTRRTFTRMFFPRTDRPRARNHIGGKTRQSPTSHQRRLWRNWRSCTWRRRAIGWRSTKRFASRARLDLSYAIRRAPIASVTAPRRTACDIRARICSND